MHGSSTRFYIQSLHHRPILFFFYFLCFLLVSLLIAPTIYTPLLEVRIFAYHVYPFFSSRFLSSFFSFFFAFAPLPLQKLCTSLHHDTKRKYSYKLLCWHFQQVDFLPLSFKTTRKFKYECKGRVVFQSTRLVSIGNSLTESKPKSWPRWEEEIRTWKCLRVDIWGGRGSAFREESCFETRQSAETGHFPRHSTAGKWNGK